MKVMSVFGTRPEAIKMVPVVKELEKRKEIESIVCVTAQHREMLDQVLNIFEIEPDYDLDLMEHGQTLNSVTAKVVTKMKEVLEEAKPDIVLVHGDTTTAYASALAAYYNETEVGHVEAGLRTNNKYSPFPEEINRQMIGLLADYHFAPTECSKSNLLIENKNAETVVVTGNTSIDTLFLTVNDEYRSEDLDWAEDSKLILFTCHRRENFGEPMENIFSALQSIVETNKDVKVIYPIHLNPRIRVFADKYLSSDRIRVVEPLDVFDFHNYISKSYMILTDSGGIQEEAPALNKPVLVMRDTTERPEGLEAGTLKLVGTNYDNIVNVTNSILRDDEEYANMSNSINPYGDGSASKRIVDFLVKNWSEKNESI